MTNTAAREQRISTARQVSELFRKRRKAKALSQAKLAGKLGLSQERLSALENDISGITLDRLISLANLLDLELVIRDRTFKKPNVEW